ncbi:MAG TPA: formate dehydrogenase [Propylenella sp.]
MKQESKQAIGRREFLRTVGAGATVAVAVPLAGAAHADTETNEEKRKARYQETDHVQTYYRVNRYPAS